MRNHAEYRVAFLFALVTYAEQLKQRMEIDAAILSEWRLTREDMPELEADINDLQSHYDLIADRYATAWGQEKRRHRRAG